MKTIGIHLLLLSAATVNVLGVTAAATETETGRRSLRDPKTVQIKKHPARQNLDDAAAAAIIVEKKDNEQQGRTLSDLNLRNLNTVALKKHHARQHLDGDAAVPITVDDEDSKQQPQNLRNLKTNPKNGKQETLTNINKEDKEQRTLVVSSHEKQAWRGY
jgi:hypothetical protein